MKLILQSGDAPKEIVIDRRLVIGRGSGADVQMNDASISSPHAEFLLDGAEVSVRDLQSTNGTFINDERITRSVLRDGDILRLGAVAFAAQASSSALPAVLPLRTDEETPVEDFHDEEHTPVDDQFAPPQAQESVDAPPASPELLSRNGKWFLRENTSGNEIEIRPVQKKSLTETAAAVDVRETARQHGLLTAAVILALGIMLVLFLRSILIQPAPDTVVWSFDRYASSVRRSIVEFDEGELGRAEYFLSLAAQKYADNDVANLLLEVVAVWKNSDLRGNLREVERVLGAVGKYAGGDFADVASWAARLQQSVRNEHTMEGKISEAQQLIADRKLKQAMDLLKQVAADSAWFPRAREMMEELSGALSEGLLSMAKEAIEEESWKKALTLFQKAIAAGIPESRVKRQMKTCRQNQLDKESIDRAKEHYENKRFSAALTSIAAISRGSIYTDQAQTIKAEITHKQALDKARRLYHRGNPRGALSALKDNETADGIALKERITDVIAAYKSADSALDAGLLDDAIESWEKITRLEDNKDNFYASRALAQLARWRDDTENRAQLYIDKATVAELRNDYSEMRDWLVKALAANPENETAQTKMKELKNEAVGLFQKALAMKNSDRDKARKMFKRVLDMLLENDPYVGETRREIKRLSNPPAPPAE